MLKTVPCPEESVRLRTVIRPPAFLTISFETHSPSPVPTSFFEVKNGSKIIGMMSTGIPDPSSAIVTRIAGKPRHSCCEIRSINRPESLVALTRPGKLIRARLEISAVTFRLRLLR